MKIGYADPPYIGCAHLYKDHPDYAGEVDHAQLIDRLQSEYDGWILHANGTLKSQAILTPILEKIEGVRECIWVKGFAAAKKGVPVMYAWEPVYIKAARKPVVNGMETMRDWIQESITMKRGFVGAKPVRVCNWAFSLVGAEPDDTLDDIFIGSGAVTKAWEDWRKQYKFPDPQKKPVGFLNVLTGEWTRIEQ